MQSLKSVFWQSLVWAIATAGILVTIPAGKAADEIVFRYGILRQRLSVVELTKFAQTGEQSPVVERYLNRTNSNPEEVRELLNRPVNIERRLLDRGLNNAAGNMVLDELGKMIQTPDDEGNREALRAALLESTAGDNQLTMLEVIQNYPTDEIHLDVKRAIRTYERIAKYQGSIQEALKKSDSLRQILKDQGINIPDFLK
ncbi:MAG: alpha/beta hydrolase [Oscillatoriales cyanobacterium C42_A2020_001]|nr:alpha/beta hydrolase [Leptolyngbyaceae cyanobacterium C42_A2020_001]